MVSEKTKKLLLKYHLPLWLFIGVAFGWSVPIIGSAWSGIIPKNEYIKMSNINVFLIFSALALWSSAVNHPFAPCGQSRLL